MLCLIISRKKKTSAHCFTLAFHQFYITVHNNFVHRTVAEQLHKHKRKTSRAENALDQAKAEINEKLRSASRRSEKGGQW